MKNKENDPRYNAQGKRIVDQAYIEKKLLWQIILYSAISAVTIQTGVIPLLLIIFKIVPNVKSYRAVRAGAFTVTEDLITDRDTDSDFYQSSDSDRMEERKRYYVYSYRSGKMSVSQREYYRFTVGGIFWSVVVQKEKKKERAVTFYEDKHCIADDLTPFLEPLPESVKEKLAEIREKQKAALYAKRVEKAAKSKRPKAVCPTCCKIYDVQKHPDACPDCGTARAK